jgi:hypothetical protein
MDFLSTLFDSIDDALTVTDINGQVLFFNKVAGLVSDNTGVPIAIGENINRGLPTEKRKIADLIFEELRNEKREIKSFTEYKNKFNNTI